MRTQTHKNVLIMAFRIPVARDKKLSCHPSGASGIPAGQTRIRCSTRCGQRDQRVEHRYQGEHNGIFHKEMPVKNIIIFKCKGRFRNPMWMAYFRVL